MRTKLNMFSAPTKTMTIGSNSLLQMEVRTSSPIRFDLSVPRSTHHGTRVILKPTRAHTLREVIVDTAISTSAVNVTPMRECTASIRLTDQATYAEKPM